MLEKNSPSCIFANKWADTVMDGPVRNTADRSRLARVHVQHIGIFIDARIAIRTRDHQPEPDHLFLFFFAAPFKVAGRDAIEGRLTWR